MKKTQMMNVQENLNGVHVTDGTLDIIFKERMKYLGLLSSAVVNELHTPLVIIRGLAESLVRNQATQANSLGHIKEIAKESEHLLKVIETMMFTAASLDAVKLQNISLKNSIDNAIIFFEKTCLDKGISLRIDIDENIRIESEPGRLQNILLSLIGNAVESFSNMPKGELKSITIHTQKDSKNLYLIISDTGLGMCPLVQEQILKNHFFSTKELQTGSGLDLLLAQKMANDLKIELSFVSEEARGTNFTLSFPKNIIHLEKA